MGVSYCRAHLEQLALGEGEVLLGEDVDEHELLEAPPLLRVDDRLQALVHLLRRMESDVVLEKAAKDDMDDRKKTYRDMVFDSIDKIEEGVVVVVLDTLLYLGLARL